MAVKILCYVTTSSDIPGSKVNCVMLLLPAKSLALNLLCYITTPSGIPDSIVTVLRYYA
jgi:hypothetical protein